MAGRQRIDRVRRQYNQWVANQTLEDYALRFTAKSARRWSAARVANTAIGAISFLALEAIGGTITLQLRRHQRHRRDPRRLHHHLLLRRCRLPIMPPNRRRHRPAHPRRRLRLYRLDHHLADLRLLHLHLLRDRGGDPGDGAGDVLRHSAPVGYIISAVAVIPLVTHGITLISRFQLWTQPIWIVLHILPFAVIAWANPYSFTEWRKFAGEHGDPAGISICCCSASHPPWCSRWWRRSASRSTSCASCRATAARRERRGGSRC